MYLGCVQCDRKNGLGGIFDQGINVITGSNAWKSMADTVSHTTESITSSPAFQALAAPAVLITAPVVHAATVTYDNPLIHAAAQPFVATTEAAMTVGQGFVEGGIQGSGKASEPYIKQGVFLTKTTAPIWAAIPGINTVGGAILAGDALVQARLKAEQDGRDTAELDAQIAGTQAKIDALKAGQSNDDATAAAARAYQSHGKIFRMTKTTAIIVGVGALAAIAALMESR